ncbi:MAG TPA: DNA polymerase/3'-5' exonuclease PolX [Spirochaetes bacterium]|nr:DNA polymerase/3'-5' exonuclease PolX [Spirochaetota bacterium]
MNNKEIASILKNIAVYKELSGENPFKARAFEQAARSVETNPAEIADLVEKGELREIKGIGKSVEEVILEYIANGHSTVLEELKSSFPGSIQELLTIPGMGPKKVKAVWDKLEISDIGELEYACKENRLKTLEGFGQKSQEKILRGIDLKKLYKDKHLFSDALETANDVAGILKSSNIFVKIAIAGSLRRGKSTFKDIDIVLVPDGNIEDTIINKTLISLADGDPGTKDVIGAGPTKVSIRRKGLQIDFRIIKNESYPAALQHFTGSKEHNTILRSRAKRMGLKMNEYGIFKGESALEIETEETIYNHIGLRFIPPEIREGGAEIEASEQGTLPELVKDSDIQGMIHVHSNFSDGAHSIEILARECVKQGYSYLCLSDHSRSAFYANGLSNERLLAQIEEVKQLNSEFGSGGRSFFKIFCGIESDILTDGSLDYPDDTLKKLDFVIASVHSKLSMGTEEATERLLTAIKNPYVTILGHISGRLLLSREGYQYDQEKILEALAAQQVVLEHNCNPYRLDPGWQYLIKASRRGVLISLGPDAHSIDGFKDIKYGLIMARKAWVSKKGLLNSMTAGEIDEFFRNRKKR